MSRYIMTALRMSLVTILLTGVLYPLLTLGLAQLLFPRQAHGSLVSKDGAIRGSQLIGQAFSQPKYFHPRPSAAGSGYDPLASGGSNLGPTSKALTARITDDVARIRKDQPNLPSIPVDMVTTSGSGLDPDITVANAYAQVTRVAKERGKSEGQVKEIIDRQATPRQWGIFGEPRVNVLALNRALDEMK